MSSKLSFAERRQLVLKRQREKAEKERLKRKEPTALQRYEAEGIRWDRRERQFPEIPDPDLQFPLHDDSRRHFIETFAEHRKETVEQVIRMVGTMTQSTGLTFDELLYHSYFNDWHGPLTVSERQHNAALKAWDTMRARKAAKENGE